MFSVFEVLEMVITVVMVGYIFARTTAWNDLKFSMIIVAPSIILHELAHKFTALATGNLAVYHANYFWLLFGIALKTIGMPIVFVPAYVSVGFLNYSPLIHFLIAIAGPLTNAVLFAVSALVIKYDLVSETKMPIFYFLKRINMLLFLFNLIPIPGTDGYQAITTWFIR